MGVGGGDGTDGEEGEVGGHPPPSHNKNMLGQNFSFVLTPDRVIFR